MSSAKRSLGGAFQAERKTKHNSTSMKRYILWGLFFLVAGLMPELQAQSLKMTFAGEVRLDEADMDAKTYYPVHDQNDNLCALIKVRPTNELKNPLALDNRGLGVTKRREMDNGEYWFWVPYQTKNLYFACKGYDEMPPIPVQLKAGKVYRISLRTDAVEQTIWNAAISFNYLRMHIVPEGATVFVGETEDCSLYSEVVAGNDFEYQLNYGRYYYRIEHPEHEAVFGQVEVSEEDQQLEIEMKPAYSLLAFESDPSDAQVFVNGKYVGNTPFRSETRYLRGEVEVRMQKKEYASHVEKIQLSGNGEVQTVRMLLDAKFATVTCTCEDPQAELWVDNVYRGQGSWTGHLSSSTKHILEARKAGHQSQSISFSVKEKEVVTKTVEAPVPLYAILSVESVPTGATILLNGEEIGKTPKVKQVVMGTYQLTLEKDGFAPKTIEIELKHNQRLTVKEELVKADKSAKKANESAKAKPAAEKKAEPRPSNTTRRLFAELNYGMGFASKRLEYRACSMNFWGTTVGYIPKQWGGYISGFYGVEYGDFVATAGLIYRLPAQGRVGGSRMDLQLYAGGGIFSGTPGGPVEAGQLQWMGDLGVRVGFDAFSSQFQCLSLSLGCKITASCLIPTLGVAISLQR